MGFDYTKTAATVLRLLTRFGAPAVLKVPGGPYNPETDTAGGAETVYPCTACAIDADRSYVDGTLIEAGAKVVLIAPQGVPGDLRPGMRLNWQGVDLQVAVAKSLAPAGVAVFHELQVKG